MSRAIPGNSSHIRLGAGGPHTDGHAAETSEQEDAEKSKRTINRHKQTTSTSRKKRQKGKLTAETVREIRSQSSSATSTPEQLGKKYGVSVSTIKAVLNRATWKDVA
ncbi:MAG TPA: hypothetical protein VD837_10065 [Terriglobales bacterium]|nr:hypothetical protein [Terriglobales bacterium]